ncbi:MAG: hypothetical protein U0235_25075 [Polyangiaceae bacterium]
MASATFDRAGERKLLAVTVVERERAAVEREDQRREEVPRERHVREVDLEGVLPNEGERFFAVVFVEFLERVFVEAGLEIDADARVVASNATTTVLVRSWSVATNASFMAASVKTLPRSSDRLTTRATVVDGGERRVDGDVGALVEGLPGAGFSPLFALARPCIGRPSPWATTSVPVVARAP